jgi:hypothetical protein
MKRILCTPLFLVILAGSAWALDTHPGSDTLQEPAPYSGAVNFTVLPSPLEKGDFFFSLDAGYLGTKYGDAFIPSLSAMVELTPFSIPLGLGGFLAYIQSRERGFTGTSSGISPYERRYSHFMFGGRAAYHFNFGLRGFDPYVGGIFGYSITPVKQSTGTTETHGYANYFIYGGFLGLRYFFFPRLGIFFEAGYGISIFHAGLTLRY